jgi:protein-tyrosine phosphatase
MTYSNSTFTLDVNGEPHLVFQTKWHSDAEEIGRRWVEDHAQQLSTKGPHGTDLPPVIKVRMARTTEKASFDAAAEAAEIYEGVKIVHLVGSDPGPIEARAQGALENTMQRVLFLCTGNYYRSRYAEELFNHLAGAEGLAWRAFSCGVAERGSSDNVGPMSPFAHEALAAKGIIVSGVRDPRPCSLADFEKAQLVIGLKETEHRPLIEQRFPEVASRVIYWHVDDVAHPTIALPMIDDHVRELISSLR